MTNINVDGLPKGVADIASEIEDETLASLVIQVYKTGIAQGMVDALKTMMEDEDDEGIDVTAEGIGGTGNNA